MSEDSFEEQFRQVYGAHMISLFALGKKALAGKEANNITPAQKEMLYQKLIEELLELIQNTQKELSSVKQINPKVPFH